MKLLPVILQGKAIVATDYLIIKSYNPDSIITGLTTASDVVVVTRKNGTTIKRTYPAGTTSIATESDGNSEIKIIGQVSSISFESGTNYSCVCRSRSLTSAAYTYNGGTSPSIRHIDLSNCPNLATFTFDNNAYGVETLLLDGCVSLASLSYSNSYSTLREVGLKNCSALQTVSFSNQKELSKVDISGCSAISSFRLNSASALEQIDLSDLTNATTIVVSESRIRTADLSNNTSVATVALNGNAQLENIILPNSQTVTSLSVGGCYSLTSIENTAGHPYNNIDISECYQLRTLTISNPNTVTEFNANSCAVLDFGQYDFSKFTELFRAVFDGTKIVNFNNPQWTKEPVLSLRNCSDLETVDVSGITNWSYMGGVSIENVPKLKLVKMRCQNSTAATKFAAAIAGSEVTDGVVYLNSADTYYSTVADAATAKGWTIEPLS